MARVLIAWELGDNFGHLLRYRGLIDSLLADSHQVSFYAKRVDYARQVFGTTHVRIEQSPPIAISQPAPIPNPNSYTEILLNTAFADPDAARERLRAWRAVLHVERPDVIIFDFSPTAMLANREYRAPAIASGNSFYNPPQCVPLPPYGHWLPVDPERAQRHEATLFERLNKLLDSTVPRLQSVADLLAVDATVLFTFPEFDYFRAYDDRRYVGAFPPDDYGVEPTWPSAAGPRVFAYLQPCSGSSRVLELFRDRAVAAVVYCPKMAAKGTPLPVTPYINYVNEPVSIRAAARDCAIAINNANLATMASFLLAGKPQLLLPFTMEKYLAARCAEIAGAALAAPGTDPLLGRKLDAVLTQREYARGAERFATKYINWTATEQCRVVRRCVDSLL